MGPSTGDRMPEMAMVDGVQAQVSMPETREDRIVRRMSEKQRKKDLQFVIGAVLDLPVSDKGEFVSIDEAAIFASLAKANTTVMARIVLNTAHAAVQGDLQATKLLWEYGGMKPVEEKRIEMALPTFIDDMSETSDPAEIGSFPMERLKPPEEKDDIEGR